MKDYDSFIIMLNFMSHSMLSVYKFCSFPKHESLRQEWFIKIKRGDPHTGIDWQPGKFDVQHTS